LGVELAEGRKPATAAGESSEKRPVAVTGPDGSADEGNPAVDTAGDAGEKPAAGNVDGKKPGAKAEGATP
jgi:hypothetical protein